jgi:hypothetical protein
MQINSLRLQNGKTLGKFKNCNQIFSSSSENEVSMYLPFKTAGKTSELITSVSLGR